MLCSGAVYISTTQLCKIKAEPSFCALPICTNFWKGLKVFNLFKLLESETSKIFIIRERRKNRHEYGGTKDWKAKKVRKRFVIPKVEIEDFSYIICSLDFKNIACTLFLLNMKMVNGVVSWYILALNYLFHFIACVSFLFLSSITCWGIVISLVIHWRCSSFPNWSFKEWHATAFFSNQSNLFGWTNWTRLSLGKILVTYYLHLHLRITCCRVSAN